MIALLKLLGHWQSLAIVLAALAATPAAAIEFDTSGFASLVAGRSFGSCQDNAGIALKYTHDCTRFITDWSHAGVYQRHWTIAPESRVGLQETVTLNNQWSATAQIVARTNDAARAALEWGYVTYKPASDWTVFVGRKRLPLFYFSDFQDVGYAYTWVRPPPDVYGWDIVNYNGASARWQSMMGAWTVKADVFTGSESSKDNAYSQLFYTQEPKTVKWTNIRGVALEFGRSWFTGRAVWMENNYQQIDQTTGTPDVLESGNTSGHQRITGLSMNIDLDPWIVRSEYSVFDRSNFQYKAHAYMVAAGYRIGRFTPMFTFSRYGEASPYPAYERLGMRSQALTVRYELNDTSALKVQLDRFNERSPDSTLVGNSRALSVGLDIVF